MTDTVPKLNRDRIRDWLERHNWTVRRLTDECNAIDDDTFLEGTLRNAINGLDPIRPGRIHVTAKYGDGLSFDDLVAPPPQD